VGQGLLVGVDHLRTRASYNVVTMSYNIAIS
jgi:hypothetical protein